MDRRLKHKRRVGAREDNFEVVEEGSRGVVSDVSSVVRRGVDVAKVVGSVVIGSAVSGVGELVLSSNVLNWESRLGASNVLVGNASSLVGDVLVSTAPVMLGGEGTLFATGLGAWGVQRRVVLTCSSRELVGGVTLDGTSHAPSLNVFFESSLPAFGREGLMGSFTEPKSLVGGVLLHSHVVSSLDDSRSLSLGVGVERELELGLDVFAGLSGSEAKLGLLEEVLSVEGGAVPRSSSAVGNGVMVFVVVEPKGSDWHLLVAHLVKVLLEEFIGLGVRIFVREVMEEGEEVEAVDSLERESLGRLNLRGVVEVFDLRRDPYSSDYVLELVKSRLPVLYTHGPGALIVVLSREEIGRELYESIKRLSSSPTYFLNLVRRGGKELENLTSLLILGSLSEDASLTEKSPYHVIKRRAKALRRTVDKLSYFVRRQVSSGKHVDVAQYGLKVATFSALIRKTVEEKLRELTREGKRVDVRAVYKAIFDAKKHLKIKVEESLEGGGDEPAVVPDITFEDEDGWVCVEVETLIGTGEPMKKIDESIEKYRNLGGTCGKVWIVLTPEASFLHMKELEERLKILYTLSEQSYPRSIAIKTLALSVPDESPLWRDAFGWVLIDLHAFEKEIKSVVRGDKA